MFSIIYKSSVLLSSFIFTFFPHKNPAISDGILYYEEISEYILAGYFTNNTFRAFV